MTTQQVVTEIAEALRAHHPFDRVSLSALQAMCRGAEIQYFPAKTTLFEHGDPPGECVWFIRRGSVGLKRIIGGEDDEILEHLCDEGDLFGLRALINEQPYSATAVAREDCLIYLITWPALKALLHEYPEVALYFAAGFAAELPYAASSLIAVTQQARAAWAPTAAQADGDAAERPVQMSEDVLTCGPDISVQQAAQEMALRNVGSIVITDGRRAPLGIVTDADLRKRVVAQGLDSASTPVSAVMTRQVFTLPEGESTPRLVATMMRRRIHHLCITADGTAKTPVIGMISEHDVLAARGRHPLVLIDEINRAPDVDRLHALRDQAEDRLRSWLHEERPMRFIAGVISEINDAVVRRAVELVQARMTAEDGPPPRRFCWLSLGSEGREEQLLRTDQDNAIVYADEGSGDEEARRWFQRFGAQVCEVLMAVGFARCPGDIMASNPEHCLPLAAWKARFTQWIKTPVPEALLKASIFFDLRPVTGDAPGEDADLGHALRDHAFRVVDNTPRFCTFFAHSALKSPPPLSFFRRFIVERSGDQVETFDLKARAMRPLADAARVLIYDLGLPVYGSTARRLDAIGVAEPHLKALCQEGALAYEMLMRYRAIEGLAKGNSGRHLQIAGLSQLQRRALRNTFEIIRQVQQVLGTRYRTDLLR